MGGLGERPARREFQRPPAWHTRDLVAIRTSARTSCRPGFGVRARQVTAHPVAGKGASREALFAAAPGPVRRRPLALSPHAAAASSRARPRTPSAGTPQHPPATMSARTLRNTTHADRSRAGRQTSPSGVPGRRRPGSIRPRQERPVGRLARRPSRAAAEPARPVARSASGAHRCSALGLPPRESHAGRRNP